MKDTQSTIALKISKLLSSKEKEKTHNKIVSNNTSNDEYLFI